MKAPWALGKALSRVPTPLTSMASLPSHNFRSQNSHQSLWWFWEQLHKRQQPSWRPGLSTCWPEPLPEMKRSILVLHFFRFLPLPPNLQPTSKTILSSWCHVIVSSKTARWDQWTNHQDPQCYLFYSVNQQNCYNQCAETCDTEQLRVSQASAELRYNRIAAGFVLSAGDSWGNGAAKVS